MNIYDQLRRDEGVRTHAYPDPLTKGSPYTIGVGHTGPDVTPDTVWTDEQIQAALIEDVRVAEAGLDGYHPWWRKLNDPRQAVMIGMVFNMGIFRFLKFVRAIGAIKAGAYDEAADCMLDSKWATQVGDRAKRLAQQMRTGEWV